MRLTGYRHFSLVAGGLCLGLSLFPFRAYAPGEGSDPVVVESDAGSEECATHDVQVKFSQREPEFYEQLSDPESGTRLKPDGTLYLEFFREPPDGVQCRVDSDDERRIICLDPETGEQMGEPVAETQDCPLYDQMRAEFDAAATKSEKREISKKYFRSFERCLGDINYERLKEAISLRGSVPRIDDAFVHCNDERAEGVTSWAHVVDVDPQPYSGIGYIARLHHKDDPFYRDCRYTLKVALETPITNDGRCLTPEALELLGNYQFWIEGDERTEFERETEGRFYDWGFYYRGELIDEEQIDRVPLQAFSIKPGVTISPEEVFERYRSHMKTTDKDHFEVRWSTDDSRGHQHAWYQQKYDGYPVLGRGYRIQTDAGNVVSVLGQHAQDLKVDASDTMPEEDAFELALLAVPATKYAWDTDSGSRPTGHLMIVPLHMQNLITDYRLAWRFDITTSLPVGGATVYIDAKTGETLHLLDKVKPADEVYIDVNAEGETFYHGRQNFIAGQLVDPTLPGISEFGLSSNGPPLVRVYREGLQREGDVISGVLLDVFDSPTTDFTDVQALMLSEGVSVHWGLQQCLKYFQDRHAWPGTSEDISEVRARVMEADSPNAKYPAYHLAGQLYFNSKPALYKPGLDLDTIAHEFGHLVNHMLVRDDDGSPSGFNYLGESGSIEEGFADIINILVGLYLGPPYGNWVAHEAIPPIGSYTNNYANPQDENMPNQNPDTYLGKEFDWSAIESTDCNETNDKCGVHKNSSIVSYWFSLLVNGGTGRNDFGDDYEVEGIGIERAERLFMHMLRAKMVASDNFYRARAASEQAADDLFGPESGEPDEKVLKAVSAAWHAVGIGGINGERRFEPENGATDVDTWPVEFAWTVYPGEKMAELELAPYLNRDDNKLLIELDIDGELLGFPFSVPPGVQIPWRVRFQDDQGEWGPWSELQFFRGAAKFPELISPEKATPLMSGGAWKPTMVDYRDVKFQWSSVEGAQSYYIQVSETDERDCIPPRPEDIAPEETRAIVNAPADMSEPVSKTFTLKPDTEYYWHVIAIGPEFDFKSLKPFVNYVWGCAESQSFQTKAIAPPSLISPGQGESLTLDSSAGVTFEWSWVDGAENYHILVIPRNAAGNAMNPLDPATPVIQDFVAQPASPQSITKTLTGAAGFENGGCWMVRAIGPNDSFGEWSQQWCYDTVLAAPLLSNPTDNEHVTHSLYEIGSYWWISIPGAVAYNIFFWERNANGTPGAQRPGLTFPDSGPHDQTHAIGMPLRNGGPPTGSGFCWTAAAVNSAGVSGPAAEPECFTVGPSTPENLSINYLGKTSSQHTTGDTFWYWQGEMRWSAEHAPGDITLIRTHYPPSGDPVTQSWSLPSGTTSKQTTFYRNAQYAFKVILHDPYGGPDKESTVYSFTTPDFEIPEPEPEPEPEEATAEDCELLSPPAASSPVTDQQVDPTPQLVWLDSRNSVDFYQVDVFRYTGDLSGSLSMSDWEFENSVFLTAAQMNPVDVYPTRMYTLHWPNQLEAGYMYGWCVRAFRGTQCYSRLPNFDDGHCWFPFFVVE